MGSSRGDGAALADRLRTATTTFLDALDADQRRAAVGRHVDPELTDWTYLPGERPGVRLADLNPRACALARDLLAVSYSDRGRDDAGRVVRLEAIRRGLPGARQTVGLPELTGQDYWLRVLGEVSDPVWSWRLSGLHLVAQATVAGDEVALTPQFFGAGPARVPAGPHAGFRALPVEEDLARRLVRLLGPDQQARAVVPLSLPSDIGSRHDPVARRPVSPVGLPYGRMDRSQREVFETLVRQYLERAPAAVSDRAWADLTDAGVDELTFSWAGGQEAGDLHAYAVAGPTVLLEYDQTQDDANHIHSVWRDLRHDWAGDVLARHYAGSEHAEDGSARA